MDDSAAQPVPTKSELEILRILWERGPSTVRDVLEALNREKETGYTTALKLLQIMAKKGLVDRDESHQTHIYRARHTRSKIQGQILRDLIERAFGGSTSGLVLQALSGKKASSEELEEIRKMLDQLEEEK